MLNTLPCDRNHETDILEDRTRSVENRHIRFSDQLHKLPQMPPEAIRLRSNELDSHSITLQGETQMEIKRNGSQPSAKGPADWFTGTVRIDSPFQTTDAARVSGAIVTFEPGARTAWHTHPLGQTLIVTSGVGRAQREGGPIEEIRPGDIIWFPPGEKHWHGASPTTAMTHIAIGEKLDGKVVDWMEKVSDEQYHARN
jgi:quercetin dioxygenase-like cupin family protein